MDNPKIFFRYLLLILACASSFLPYVILYLASAYGTLSVDLSTIGSLIWLLLVIVALKTNQWQRSLFWLFAFFPVAFGPWLVIFYMMLHAWLFDFAP